MADFHELEESLTRLAAIDAVRIVAEGDKVTEVHVLAAADKPAKQVVRDVQSLAMARFGTTIDRRVISVVQLTPDAAHRIAPSSRPVLVGIREEPEDSRVTVHVTLGWQGREYVGSAHGPAATSARLRLVGEATLHALEALYPTGPPLALDAIGPATMGMRTVVIAVVVSSAAVGGEEVAAGSALAQRDDLAEAAVRAVLDALNRRLSTMTE